MENGAVTRATGHLVHCFYSGPSGASTVAVSLACRLAEHIPQAAILYGVPVPRANYLEALDVRGIPWEYVPKRPGPQLGAYLRAARRLATWSGADGLVILHGLRLFPVLGALRLLRPRVRAVGYVHGPTEELRGPCAWRAVGTALAADHLVTVTDELRVMLGRLPLCGRAAGAAVVVPNGVDPALWRPDPARRPPGRDELRLCCVGVLTARKRTNLALDALATLRMRGLAARLEICGDGPERPRLEAQVRELAMTDAVVFRGLLPPEALRAALATCHALIHPSRSEGLSMAVLEALACGCPVVTGGGLDSSAAPAGIASGRGLVGSRAATGEGIADAVEGLAANPGIWAQEAEAGRLRVAREYTVDGQVRRFMAALSRFSSTGCGAQTGAP